MRQSRQILTILVSGALTLGSVHTASASEPEPAPEVVVPPATATTSVAQRSPDELGQLMAPIALYPDALVAQILAASSYPVEVVEAERWMQQHADMKGQALAQAVDQQSWDPSIKALAQFPSVLATMDRNLSWTSALGEAYVNEPQNVLDAVQVMRGRAQQAGNLRSTPQETVTNDGAAIDIEPANPEVVYVPEYDPWLVYGTPITFYPGWADVPGAYLYGPGIDFGLGIGLFAGFGWGWHHWGADWHQHVLVHDHHPYFSHSPTFFHHGEIPGRGAFGRSAGALGHFEPGRPDFGHAAIGHRDFSHADVGHPGIARPDFGHPDVGHPDFARPDFGGHVAGFAEHASPGIHSGAFGGFDHGGVTGAYSARGRASFGGGIHVGGFHGGGGHR